MAAKPLLIRLHRWVGLAVGLLVILQGVTGAAVAFRHELNRLVHPDALVVTPPARLAPLTAVAAAAKAAFPDRRLARIDTPVQPDDAYLVRLDSKSGGMAFAAVDPGSARVLRSGPLAAWPVELLFQLHMSLLSGDTGERVVGFTGLGVLFMALTGPFVWWPGRGRIRNGLAVNLAVDLHRGSRDLHRLGGLLAAPVLALTAGTGVLMAWQPWLAPAVSLVAPVAETPAPKAPAGPCAAPHTLDQAVAAAATRHPAQTVKSVRFPGKGGKVVAVYFRALGTSNARATDHVWVDACSAMVLREKGALSEPAGSQFFNGLLWIHTGQWLGGVGRVLALLAALTLAGLGVTGFLQWAAREARMRRNRAARAAKARAA
ncbi:MAG TPA: PepSY-associated TM helix domain-containing protein [Phenylobacterium sp.]|nr:PepSY-associated TM helix domain-containing protein [Phenylobacterium sp.]